MLTYGYLGVIARHTRRCQSDPNLHPLTHILIADHGFGPPELKHTIYRLGATGRRLRSINLCNQDLLAPRFRDAIYKHLKSLQGKSELRMMGDLQARRTDNIALLVEAAPVINALQLDQTFDPKLDAQSVQRRAAEAGLTFIQSFKQLEISLTVEGERRKSIRKGERLIIDPKFVSFASCPTSMLAVELVLQGIQVDLSPLHPLADQLGLQVPSIGRKDALELMYKVICRTTFCVPRLRLLEKRMNNFNPSDVLSSEVVDLKP